MCQRNILSCVKDKYGFRGAETLGTVFAVKFRIKKTIKTMRGGVGVVGLIIATHGDLSRSLMRSVSLIAGEYRNIITLCLEKNDNADDFYGEIESSIEKAEEGDGVMIFTDILGGTPSNLCTLAARRHHLFCLTGLNLSMMIEFLMSAEDGLTLKELADRCFEAASSGIRITNKV